MGTALSSNGSLTESQMARAKALKIDPVFYLEQLKKGVDPSRHNRKVGSKPKPPSPAKKPAPAVKPKPKAKPKPVKRTVGKTKKTKTRKHR